jgi:predicted dehydrogenase
MSEFHSVTTRREFLRRSGIAGAALAFPAVVRGANLNSRVQVAAIGLEGMGYTDAHNIAKHERVRYVGFCDIDARNFARVDKLAPGTPHFADFRLMLERLGDTVDAVNIATPDHMHALPAVMAMQRRKHVYLQKPLAHTVWECRQLRLWAAKTGVVTQMGNQVHSQIEYRLATRLLRDGVIGKVKEVYSWVHYNGNGQTRLLEPPAQADAVPPEVNWDLWLGGAPFRPFVATLYHPLAWRDWQDFGGGSALGDFGCHLLDPIFTGLGLKAPLTIGAENTGVNRHVWPTAQTIEYVFPGNDLTAGKTLRLTWSDGGLRPDRKLAQMPAELDLPRNGSLIVGERGNMVLPHVGGPRLYPAENFAGFEYPKDLKGLNHWHRWIDAILAGEKTSDGFDYAGPLTETVQLGNVATRALKPPPPKRGAKTDRVLPVLEWDAKAGQFTNNAEANRWLTKTYRDGWSVPAA